MMMMEKMREIQREVFFDGIKADDMLFFLCRRERCG